MDQIKKIKVGSTYYSMLPEGGTAGQVLKKNSNTDFDVSWSNDSNTQSNWVEDNSTDPSYVQNRPAVRAGGGNNAVIEGDIENNIGLAQYSHAEGSNTFSLGAHSHSEGIGTVAYEDRSHAEGFGYGHDPNYYPDALGKLTGNANSTTYTVDTVDGIYMGAVLYYNGVYAGVRVVRSNMTPPKLILTNTLDSENALSNATVKIVTGVASGLHSHSEGGNTRAHGNSSHSEGTNTIAINSYEHAQGSYNKTNQTITTFGDAGNTLNSIGIGTSEATRKNAVEVMQNGDVYVYGIGDYDGTNPNTTGIKTLQAAINDLPEPVQSDWEEDDSTDISYVQNRPAVRAGTGTNSVVEGNITNNIASGQYSHAEGTNTKAFGDFSHAEGINAIAYDHRSHAEGFGFVPASSNNVVAFKVTGSANNTSYTIDTEYTDAFQNRVIYYNGVYAKITGGFLYGGYNFIDLDKTLDSQNNLSNVDVLWVPSASHFQAHTEGAGTTAAGNSSHSEGYYTIAVNSYEHAQGKHNKSNMVTSSFGNAGNTLNSIGIGTSEATRKNAVEVMQNGDMYVYGVGDYDGTNPNTTGVKTLQATINDLPTPVQSDWNETTTTDLDYILNKPAIKAGTGTNSIIEGDITNNVSSGTGSIAEGENTRAFGNYSHTEGYGTIAYDERTHAEGYGFNVASAITAPFKLTTMMIGSPFYTMDTPWDESFVRRIIYYNGIFARIGSGGLNPNNNTYWIQLDKEISTETITNAEVLWVPAASYLQSHTEGAQTTATGNASHAEGNNTLAINSYEHAQGQFNKSNKVNTTFGNAGNTLNSIGIGTSDSNRKNSIEVMQNGDVYVYGIGDYDGTNPNTTGVKTLQDAINDGSSGLEVEEATFPSGAAAGATQNYNIVLVDGSSSTSPYDPQSGNVVTINNSDSISGLGVRIEHLGGGTTLYCDSYTGNINYAATTIPSGKVIIGSSNNKGSFRSTTQDVPTSTSATSYTNDYIIGGQALFKATERYIISGNSITSINANYNVGYYTSWWGSSTPSLGFSAFPTNKHMTLFIMGELTDVSSVHNFIIPLNLSIGTDKPIIFLNGARMTTSTTISVENNRVVELDAYYVVIGTEKHLIIRIDSTVTPIN